MYLLGGTEFQKFFGQAYSCQSFPSVADLPSRLCLNRIAQALQLYVGSFVLFLVLILPYGELWTFNVISLAEFLVCTMRMVTLRYSPFQVSLLLPLVKIMLPYQVHFKLIVST